MPSRDLLSSKPTEVKGVESSTPLLDLAPTFETLSFERQSPSRNSNAPTAGPFSSTGTIARELIAATARVMSPILAPTCDPNTASIVSDSLTSSPVRVAYDSPLEYPPRGSGSCGAQIFYVVADPQDSTNLHLRTMPGSTVDREARSEEANRTVEDFDEVSKKFNGNLRAILSFFRETPALSEFAAMLRLEDTLKKEGRDVLVRPAAVIFSGPREPNVSIWQCDRSALASAVTREEQVLASFKEALSILIHGMRDNPHVRLWGKQPARVFLREVLLLQEAFAFVFLDRVLLGDTSRADAAFNKALDLNVKRRGALSFTRKITDLRVAIERKEEPPERSLREHAGEVARLFMGMLTSQAISDGFVRSTPLSIDRSHTAAAHDIRVRDKVKPVILRKRTFSTEEVASIGLDHARVSTLESYSDLVFVKPTRGASRFQDLGLLHGKEPGTTLLHLSAVLAPFVEYEGVTFVPNHSEVERRSIIFGLERAKSQVLLAAASTERFMLGKGKGADSSAFFADRLSVMVAAINECGLAVDSAAFSEDVIAFTKSATVQTQDFQSFIPDLRLVEEQALDALLLEHLKWVGITKPCFFEHKDRRLRFLPVAVKEVLLEPLLTAVAGENGYESLPQKELVAWFAPLFFKVPDLFRPAAQAIAAGLDLKAVFSEDVRKEILLRCADLISLGESIGLKTLGERIISAEARRRLKTLEPFPPLNSRDDLKALTAILNRMRESERAIIEKCQNLQRVDRLRATSPIPSVLQLIDEVTVLASRNKDGRRPEEFDDVLVLLRPSLARMSENERNFIAEIDRILKYEHKKFVGSFGRHEITKEYLRSVQQAARSTLTEFDAAVGRIREVTIGGVISLACQLMDERARNEEFERDWKEQIAGDFKDLLKRGTTLTKDDVRALYIRMRKSLGSDFVGVCVYNSASDSNCVSFEHGIVGLNAARVKDLTPVLLSKWAPPEKEPVGEKLKDDFDSTGTENSQL
jgi:hypothetical protein